MKKLPRILVNLSLTLGTLIVVLAIAEVLIRVTGLAPTGGVHTVNERKFPAVPGMFSPGQSSLVTQNRHLPHRVTINSLGFRGDDFPIEKVPGEFRILMVGDSFTFGDQVDDEYTLPALLEVELRGKCSSTRIVNGGVGGTSIYDQRHIIIRGLAVAPDAVVLVFYENDVADLAGSQMWDELQKNRRKKSRFPYSVLYWPLRSTGLWGLLMHARGHFLADRGNGGEPDAAAKVARSPNEALRSKYIGELRELRDVLANRGMPLAVTAFPAHLTLDGTKTWEQLDWIAAAAANLGIPYIDVARPMAASGLSTDQLYLLPWDGHASPMGLQVVAASLAGQLAHWSPLVAACQAQ